MEVKKLQIDIENTKGWDLSGGKSYNVWGQVPIPKEILTIANKAKSRSKKLIKLLDLHEFKMFPPSIWTAFDKILYADDTPVEELDLPSTISATFKSCFGEYSAVVENMCMRIAFALDLPTSYNYIVKFDPEQYPKIVQNYPNQSIKSKLSKLGIVSIDFLQPAKGEATTEEFEEIDENGKIIKVKYYDDQAGDILIPFDDIVTKVVGNNRLSGDQNLIENWIKSVDLFVEQELSHLPRERINKIIHKVHSRIARSFLLKEYCGDCDNTSYNASVVYNKSKGKLEYGPNHDFGDGFNKLIKSKINPSQTMSQEDIDRLPQNIKEKLIERLSKERSESVACIARQFAVFKASEQNFNYILEHFPESAKEFFKNVQKCVNNKTFEKIVNSYTAFTCDGKQLLTRQEADIFIEYLQERSTWMMEMYYSFLKQTNQTVPDIKLLDSNDSIDLIDG